MIISEKATSRKLYIGVMKWALLILIPLLFSCRQQPVDHFTRGKMFIDSLYWANRDSLSYTYEGMEGTFRVGHFFNKEYPEVVMRYYLNDSTEQVIIKRKIVTGWYVIFLESIRSARYRGINGFITIQDFNGDHIPDLKVIKDYAPEGELSDLWLYQHNRFVRVKNFDKIPAAHHCTFESPQ